MRLEKQSVRCPSIVESLVISLRWVLCLRESCKKVTEDSCLLGQKCVIFGVAQDASLCTVLQPLMTHYCNIAPQSCSPDFLTCEELCWWFGGVISHHQDFCDAVDKLATVVQVQSLGQLLHPLTCCSKISCGSMWISDALKFLRSM